MLPTPLNAIAGPTLVGPPVCGDDPVKSAISVSPSTVSLNRPTNLGYLIDGRILHPGDEFPDIAMHSLNDIEILFLPVAAPWLKVSETVEFAHSILPRLSLPIHDAILSAEGKALVDSILTATKVPGYVRPDLLTTIEL